MATKKTMQASSIVLLALLAVSRVHGLTFTETTDFSNALSPNGLSVGTLDLGENTIFGSLLGTCDEPSLSGGNCNTQNDDTQDSPIMTVAPGTQIDSVLFSYKNFTGPDGVGASFSGAQNVGGFNWNNLGQLGFAPLEGSLVLGNGLALPAGLYGFSIFGQASDAPGIFSLDYTVTIIVTAVPIPGALVLFASAIVFGLRRRSRD